MLGFVDAFHANAAKFQNTVRESFQGSFVSLVWKLQILFTQEVVAAPSYIDISERKALVDLRGSISECGAAAKGRLDWLFGGNSASSGTGPAVFDAVASRRASGASGAGASKYCLLYCILLENLSKRKEGELVLVFLVFVIMIT